MIKNIIEKGYEDLYSSVDISKDEDLLSAVNQTLSDLDKGKIRVAEKSDNRWVVNDWIKKAILLYFSLTDNSRLSGGISDFYDKVPLKYNNLSEEEAKANKIRIVPRATARYGSYQAPGVILMPSYVNIGAYVDENTMVDTWATVGSCAQIGKNVHISGGVGIGGVLEPIQANPVIIEDNCFIGSRCIVVEGVKIHKEAVLGAGVVLTKSTKIIDVTGSKKVYYHAEIPERSVVIPGTYQKKFKAGEFSVPCALIIGKRKESTDKKTSLNAVLRDFEIST